MAEYEIYHVLPNGSEWVVKKEKDDRVVYKFENKKEAREKARELAKDHSASVVIHRSDGTVEETLNPVN